MYICISTFLTLKTWNYFWTSCQNFPTFSNNKFWWPVQNNFTSASHIHRGHLKTGRVPKTFVSQFLDSRTTAEQTQWTPIPGRKAKTAKCFWAILEAFVWLRFCESATGHGKCNAKFNTLSAVVYRPTKKFSHNFHNEHTKGFIYIHIWAFIFTYMRKLSGCCVLARISPSFTLANFSTLFVSHRAWLGYNGPSAAKGRPLEC